MANEPSRDRHHTVVARHYRSAEPITMHLAHGNVEGVETLPFVHERLPWVAPALVDIQVNGFGGHDLNTPSVRVDDVQAISRLLWRAGVARWCPTITTGSRADMTRSLETVAAACDQDTELATTILGIHVEGPYISPDDGPRGAHPLQHVRQPSWEEFQRLQEAARGRIVMLTLAPEREGALSLIERVSATGVVVALGHHAASGDTIRSAVQAGARLSTHLGNGAHAMLPRHPNYLWDQLACDDLSASIIADGHHLPPSVVRSFVRVKGLDRIILTSDAVWVAGLTPGRYTFMGKDVELLPERRVQLAGTPFLAGSALELSEGVGNTCRFAKVAMPDAIDMASVNPARLLGHELPNDPIGAGGPAHLMLFDWEETERVVHVQALYLDGDLVYART